MEKKDKTVKVLFVCMGNICRSPSAEAVMNAYIKKAELSNKIICDSAGTISYHAGEPADARMQHHAKKRGYRLTSISRPIHKNDLEEFNYIIAMDEENMTDIKSMGLKNGQATKLSLITDFCSNENPGFVPDPYYGGDSGFENVLDLLEDACEGLLKHIKNEHKFEH